MRADRVLSFDGAFRLFGEPVSLEFLIDLKNYLSILWAVVFIEHSPTIYRLGCFDLASDDYCYLVLDPVLLMGLSDAKLLADQLINELDLDWTL